MSSDISCSVRSISNKLIQGGRYLNITFVFFVTVKESFCMCRAEGSLHDKSQLTSIQQKSPFTVSLTRVNSGLLFHVPDPVQIDTETVP